MMKKKGFDIIFSLIVIIILSPILLIFAFFVFLQDGHSPFYMAWRVGKNGKMFHMMKLRSMVMDADTEGIDTASTHDSRITKLGKIIRKLKLDEVFQLWNVLKGDMSLVGPRPNVKVETDLYTSEEQGLLSVKPGITDLSSIVFSDLGEIVSSASDTNIAYNQLVRPWKSRLGLFYINHMSFVLDIKIMFLTFVSIFSRHLALKGVTKILKDLEAPENLIQISKREMELVPTPPPGSDRIVTER